MPTKVWGRCMTPPVSRSRAVPSTKGAGRPPAHVGAISLGPLRRGAPHPPADPPFGGHAVTNASANQTETTKLTQATYDRLVAELEDLTTRGRVEIAQAIESARALGDLSENGDYHAAKDSQGKMESRVRQLDNVIRNHEIVERDENSNTVEHATIVQIVYEGDGEDDRQEFFIGSIEEKPEGVLVASPTSPLGSALLGRAVGDEVEYEAPSGVLRLTIVGIR